MQELNVKETRVRAMNAPWYAAVELMVEGLATDGSGARVFVAGLVTKEVVDGVRHAPSVTITREAAQVLMDDLWHCGFRPAEVLEAGGTLEAMKAHLEDMRRIAFGYIELGADDDTEGVKEFAK